MEVQRKATFSERFQQLLTEYIGFIENKKDETYEFEIRYNYGRMIGYPFAIFNRLWKLGDEPVNYQVNHYPNKIRELIYEDGNSVIQEKKEVLSQSNTMNEADFDTGSRMVISSEVTKDDIFGDILSSEYIQQKKIYENSADRHFILDLKIRTEIPNLDERRLKSRDAVKEIYSIEMELKEESTNVPFETLIAELRSFFFLLQNGDETIPAISVAAHSSVCNAIRSILQRKTVISSSGLVEARNLKLADIVSGGIVNNKFTTYTVTHKTDGVRKQLVISQLGWGIFSRPYNFRLLHPEVIRNHPLTILDGELLPGDKMTGHYNKNQASKWVYFIFDAIIVNDQDVRDNPHNQRLEKARAALGQRKNEISHQKEIAIWFKDFKELTGSNFFPVMQEMISSSDNQIYPTDGLIFTPNSHYNFREDRNERLTSRTLVDSLDVVKWKPAEKLTIDVFFDESGSPYSADDIFLNITVRDPPSNGIYELGFDYNREEWYVTRSREDKNSANTFIVIESVMRDVQKPITGEDLMGQTMALVNRYQNRVKKQLLNRGKGILLDLGSGRGGDISKWGRYSQIFAVEPNEKNTRVFEQRLKNSPFQARVRIIRAKAEDTDLISKEMGGIQVDVISMMLSATFFWKNRETLSALTRTIDTFLKPGGKLLIFTMDGNAVMNVFLSNRGYATQSFLNYEITLATVPKEISRGEGQQITLKFPENTIVGNQIEYAVYLENLKVLLPDLTFGEVKTANDEKLLTDIQRRYASLFSTIEATKNRGEELKTIEDDLGPFSLLSPIATDTPFPLPWTSSSLVRTKVDLHLYFPEGKSPEKLETYEDTQKISEDYYVFYFDAYGFLNADWTLEGTGNNVAFFIVFDDRVEMVARVNRNKSLSLFSIDDDISQQALQMFKVPNQ